MGQRPCGAGDGRIGAVLASRSASANAYRWRRAVRKSCTRARKGSFRRWKAMMETSGISTMGGKPAPAWHNPAPSWHRRCRRRRGRAPCCRHWRRRERRGPGLSSRYQLRGGEACATLGRIRNGWMRETNFVVRPSSLSTGVYRGRVWQKYHQGRSPVQDERKPIPTKRKNFGAARPTHLNKAAGRAARPMRMSLPDR